MVTFENIDIDKIDEKPRYGYTSQEIRNLKNVVRRNRLSQQKIGKTSKRWVLAILTREGLVKHYLDRIEWFKTASNELPEELVQGHYKCRGNYIVGLRGALKSAISEEITFSDFAREQMNKFFGYSFKYYKAERTTPEEIDFINETLDIVIDDLERLFREE